MRQRYPIIFVYAAALVAITHAADMCNSQRIAGDVLASAYVLPGHEDGDVMMLRMRVVIRIEVLLPFAEILERDVRVCGHVQFRFGKRIVNKYYSHDGDFNEVADTRVRVQGRNL